MLGTLVLTVHKSVLSLSLHPCDCPIDNSYGLKSGLELSSFIDPSTSLGGTDSGSGDLAGFAQPVNASKLFMPLLTNQVKNKNPTPPSGEMELASSIEPVRASASQRGAPLFFGVGYFSAFDLSTSLVGWTRNGGKNEGLENKAPTERKRRLMNYSGHPRRPRLTQTRVEH